MNVLKMKEKSASMAGSNRNQPTNEKWENSIAMSSIMRENGMGAGVKSRGRVR
jgi:hypothetical protein